MDQTLTIERIDTDAVVTFQTASLMNPSELERISATLAALVDGGTRGLLLDFTNVQFLSSQGIGIMLAMRKKLNMAGGGKLMICGLCPRLKELLKITRIDQVVNIRPTREDFIKPAP